MYEEQSIALANLATATSSDRRALDTLTSTVAKLTADLKTKEMEIKKLKSAKPKPGRPNDNQDTGRSPYVKRNMGSYCWSHGFLVYKTHCSANCKYPNEGHLKEATRADTMGGNQEGKP